MPPFANVFSATGNQQRKRRNSPSEVDYEASSSATNSIAHGACDLSLRANSEAACKTNSNNQESFEHEHLKFLELRQPYLPSIRCSSANPDGGSVRTVDFEPLLALEEKRSHIWSMLRITPILLAVLYAFAMYRISVWRTHRELDAKSTELADPALKRMTDRLAAALGIDRVPVYIYEIDPVNGLAAPDGRIFITRGFYRKFLNGEVSAEEMASVIAHELGHVALGHARRRMIDFSGQNALRAALMMLLNRFIPFHRRLDRQYADPPAGLAPVAGG